MGLFLEVFMKIAAIEAGGTKFVCGLVDESGQVLKQVTIPTDSPEVTLRKIKAFYEHEGIDGIGLGCFGPIELKPKDAQYGKILNTPKLLWKGFNIVKALEDELKVPVAVDTDVNAAALGEYYWGAGKGHKSCLYMTIGTGIGAGFVREGQTLLGHMHPEMGHIFVKRNSMDSFEGTCPYHHDCLEGLASGTSIQGRKKSEQGHEELWNFVSDYIAQAICNYLMILSPEVIILGGGVMKHEGLIDSIRTQVDKKLNGYLNYPELKIVKPQLSDQQGIKGAMTLFLHAQGLLVDTDLTQPQTLLEPLFLEPHFKERIWGGSRLKEVFGYNIPADQTGECWGVAVHPNGESLVAKGALKGKTLGSVWTNYPEILGNQWREKFPLMTKIIDAREDLSVQVHPDDLYASYHENGELGKNECWYIIDCEPGAEIIIGHQAQSKEELKKAIESGNLEELLCRVPVKAGDFFNIPSGTVHAIGAGIMILETQQNSDCTYRLYDYKRKDSSGKERELHIQQALDVITFPQKVEAVEPKIEESKGVKRFQYISNSYFTVQKLEVDSAVYMPFLKEGDYMICSVIEGKGWIKVEDLDFEIKKGDHFIIPHLAQAFDLKGQMHLVISHC